MFRSLYIHFPFCETKCHYCDFYSLGRERAQVSDPTRFETALRIECERAADSLAPALDTLFFGGGTPSMTPPESMARSIEPLRLPERVSEETEWTMEANPSSVDPERLRRYRELGVNRISMGVQALNDDLLARLGRVHSSAKAVQALGSIFEAGFENVSVDLLCGVPGQSLADLEKALATLTSFPITHLSCYLLTLPKTHRMFRELPNDDIQLEHLLTIDRWMRARGFEHYEVSNYAKPGKEARHNLNYWTGASYLGLGPSAHSFDAEKALRWKNYSSLHKYASLLQNGNSVVEWTEELTSEQKNLEAWLLALRLAEGFPKSWLKSQVQRDRANLYIRDGLIEPHPRDSERLRLTARGFALSDHVISSLA